MTIIFKYKFIGFFVMMRRVAVGDVMTRNFISVDPYTNLLDCARKMVKQRVGSLIITKDTKLIGIITQKDILWAITKKPRLDLRELKAVDVATRKVAVIKPSATIAEAFIKMKEYGFRRLPVLSRGELVGVLTLKDILAIDPTLYTETSELFDLRESEQKMRVLSSQEGWETEGLCEECGAFSDLVRVESRLLCADCRNDLD